MTYAIAKRNHRLVLIEAETDKVVYSPPEFVRTRMRGRDPMVTLLADLRDGRELIEAIKAFESSLWRPKPPPAAITDAPALPGYNRICEGSDAD